MGFRSGDFNIQHENDFFGDGEDRLRTASLRVSVGDFSVGFNLFTGRRDIKGESRLPTNTTGEYGKIFKNGFANEQGTPYRLGALTFGYRGYRIGVNSEHIRHAIQTRFIHDLIGDRAFRNMSWDWQGYSHNTEPLIRLRHGKKFKYFGFITYNSK
ncbi:MAG: polymorphic toxin type 23 domain-containing protein [Flavobacteriaceae bacterium]|nr:polymorphic toxin type 23 domain-containing protein [Flavobacteriaceae bacterium]